MVEATERCISAGRFSPTAPAERALQLWAAVQGLVTMTLSGLVEDEQLAAQTHQLAWHLYIGYGDTPDAAIRSVQAAAR